MWVDIVILLFRMKSDMEFTRRAVNFSIILILWVSKNIFSIIFSGGQFLTKSWNDLYMLHYISKLPQISHADE